MVERVSVQEEVESWLTKDWRRKEAGHFSPASFSFKKLSDRRLLASRTAVKPPARVQLTVLPHDQQLARDKDGTVRPRNGSDKHCQHKVLDRDAAEEQQGYQGKDQGKARHERARQGLRQALIHDRSQVSAGQAS